MTLSPRTKELLMEAEGNLRSALANASRSESPQVILMISQILSSLEDVSEVDDKMEMMKGFMKRMGG
jgi:hypothetical protein